jgi:phospholipid-binding lipoprotein MlaA
MLSAHLALAALAGEPAKPAILAEPVVATAGLLSDEMKIIKTERQVKYAFEFDFEPRVGENFNGAFVKAEASVVAKASAVARPDAWELELAAEDSLQKSRPLKTIQADAFTQTDFQYVSEGYVRTRTPVVPATSSATRPFGWKLELAAEDSLQKGRPLRTIDDAAFAQSESQPESGVVVMGETAPAVSATAPTSEIEPPVQDASPRSANRFPDPLEPINRLFYKINQPIDRYALRPVALAYQAAVPKPLREGARNAISNLGEPVVLLNDLVQLRPKRALKTLGRLIINSTIGAFGLFDIAKRKPFNIARRNNGFGNTLGYYGIGPVMYIYLPVLGPNTLRDFAGQYGDSYFQDRNLNKIINPDSRAPYFRTKPRLGTWGTVVTVVGGLDQRAEFDTELRAITENSVDAYASLRVSFMQDRAGEIATLKAKDGEAPRNDALDDPLTDPEAEK